MAKTRKFKCSKCDRRFKMAAHLARHMNTIHAAKRRTKSRPIRRKVRRRKAGAAASMIGQVWRYRRQLADKREALDSQIASIDNALSAISSG